MEDFLEFFKKNASTVGFIIGALLIGTKFDPRKIVIFGKKKDSDDNSKDKK